MRGGGATSRLSSAPLRGIAIMVAACLLFPVGDSIAKHLVGTYHVLMILWLKYVFQTASVVLVILLTQNPRAFRSRRPGTQIARGVAGIGSYGTFLLAISYIPLADALAIEFSSPMIVVALSAPLLGERVGGKRWAVVLAGFAGTLLIVRPGMGVVHWAATLMLFAAFCVALMQLMSAVLAKVDHPMTSLFYLSLTGLVLTSLPVPFFWELPDASAWALMVAVGAIAAFCHYLFVWAFQFAAASLLAPFIYAQIVGAIVLGFALFGDVPDRWAVAGTALVVASGLYLARISHRSVPR